MQGTTSSHRIQIISLLILTMLCSVGFCRKKTVKELQNYLFEDYSSDLLPVYNHSTVINVTHRLIFRNLLNLDTIRQTTTIQCDMKMTWKDEFLTWNSTDFDGLTTLIIPVSKIWNPDITLIGNADTDFERFKPNTVARVDSDGNVTWYAPAIFTSTCIIRVKWFPFDTQRCNMEFSSWGLHIFELDLHHEKSVDGTNISYIANGVWDLMAVRAERQEIHYPCCPEPYPVIFYHFIFRRNSIFYVYYMVLPCFFLSTVSLLVFFLPPDCGEKLTLAITNLLALVVFQQVLASNMPPSSDESPVIGMLFLFMIAMVCASVIATTLVMHLSATSRPIPQWVKRIFFDIIPRLICLSYEPIADTNVEHTNLLQDTNNLNAEQQLSIINGIENIAVNRNMQPNSKEISQIALTLSYLKNDIERKNAEDLKRLQWRRVSIILDRVLLYIFSSSFIVCTLLLVCEIIVGSTQDYDEALREI